jgi:protein-tyrosine phosphatase
MQYDQIIPGIYCGSCPTSATDIDALQREAGINAVLNMQTDEDFDYWSIDWRQLEEYYRQAGIEVRRVPVRDFDPDDLRSKLRSCVAALDELLKQGHCVYVHCNAGMNRSPSTVIAYLHWMGGQDLDAAVAHVLRCRPCDPCVDVIRLVDKDA